MMHFQGTLFFKEKNNFVDFKARSCCLVVNTKLFSGRLKMWKFPRNDILGTGCSLNIVFFHEIM